ncbi:hypothetical protein CC78DRAFT_457009 [Lojkania enalia]|uniref:Transcription factor Rba50 n=1 Tax=Lojkania enalia TaxID=147567 RepID=A0A9P4N6M2_9PLEO|nr:hypothetical protein CC78DRAFT_457009 [Didymosphaeria enalia]
MSFTKGERVYLDPDSDPNGTTDIGEGIAPSAPSSATFVGDILERHASTAHPPSAPAFKTNTAGFPVHRKRKSRTSAFKQQRAIEQTHTTSPAQVTIPSRPQHSNIDENEKWSIDEENKKRLAAMSLEEIEQEQRELLSSLSPNLIKRLLGRSNIDEGANERDLGLNTPAAPATDAHKADVLDSQPLASGKVNFTVVNTQPDAPQADEDQTLTTSVTSSSAPASGFNQIKSPPEPNQFPSLVHLPKPPPPTELDPNSNTFLIDLHEKYFPDLPYDPSSVSWMKPIDDSDTTSPYHPSQTAFKPAEFRFNFRGALLAPSAAREIPVTKGLHHHGEAPEAAGYTIPELARLSRSAVPAQRCIAFQTLGRILFRLGRGEFGMEEGKHRVQAGLWHCIEEGGVIETLMEEASREKGHLTARTYAQEALWNWRRGGGRRRKAV